MSNIVVTENFKNLWKSGVRRLVDEQGLVFTANNYLFPPRASEQEPLPEEMDAVIAAVQPSLMSGATSSNSVGIVLASHAGALGMRPQSLAPIYFLSGVNEIIISDRSMLLQFPERTALPLIFTDPFPISLGDEVHRTQGLPPDRLNRMYFMAYDNLMFGVEHFSSADQRMELIANGVRNIAEPYMRDSVEAGPYLDVVATTMRYTGCCRMPTLEEIDAWFARIQIGSVLHFPFSVVDVFNMYGLRTRDYEEARYRAETVAPTAATEPRAGTSTNVPAQDFSGENRRPSRRQHPTAPRPRAVGTLRMTDTPSRATNIAFGSNPFVQAGNFVADEIVFDTPPPNIPEPRPTFRTSPHGSSLSFHNNADNPPVNQPPI